MSLKSTIKALGLHKIPFVGRLRSRVREMRIPNKDVVVPCHGMQMLVRNPRLSLIGRAIYDTGVWEPEVTRFASSKIRKGMTVLDVGADVGYYSLLFARLVGPEGRVLAFEPIPKACWYLDRNVEINGLSNVSTFDFALFDSAGLAQMEDPFVASRLSPASEVASEGAIQVEMKVFDEWQAEAGIDGVDLVKLDVEGAELNVLRGMRGTLEQHRPAILVEVHPQYLVGFGFSTSDLLEFLSDLQYRVEPVDRPEIDFSLGITTLYCE